MVVDFFNIRKSSFFSSPPRQAPVPSSPGAACRTWAASSTRATFSLLILHTSCFPLSPCSPSPVPGVESWRSQIQAVRASPLFFSTVNMPLLVLLYIPSRFPGDMYGNTGEVNGTWGEILKIFIYIGTPGKSYFQNLFWSVGEFWKLLKLHRMRCLLQDLLCPSQRYPLLTASVWCCAPRATADFWTELLFGLHLAQHISLVLLFSSPVSPALLGLVAFSFLVGLVKSKRTFWTFKKWGIRIGLTNFFTCFSVIYLNMKC